MEKWIHTQERDLINVSKIEFIKSSYADLTAVFSKHNVEIVSLDHNWNDHSSLEEKRNFKQIKNIYCDLMIFLEDDSKNILSIDELINKEYKEIN